MNNPLAAGAAAAYIRNFHHCSFADEEHAAHFIYETRIRSRRDSSENNWLNSLLKDRIAMCDHIDNPMYLQLLSGDLNSEQWQCFLSEYYWGSGYGFQRIVLKEALKKHFGAAWHAYIKDIIREECTPSAHYKLFEEFIDYCDFKLQPQGNISKCFIEQQVQGYAHSPSYSFGYALGIEVEADFQISLLAVALHRNYAEAMLRSPFFDIHMDQSGEQMHLNLTCEYIERLVQNPNDQRLVEAGFNQAIVNTKDFVCGIQFRLQHIAPELVC